MAQVPFEPTPTQERAPFETTSFAENPEPRCPCLLLLDRSGSMAGQRIRELNDGLVTFKDELAGDALAAKRVEVAVVSFGGTVEIAADFGTADTFQTPTLHAGGDTPMGAAILQGIEMLRTRKDLYRQNGVAYYRPWIFLITDGGPTDPWNEAATRIKEGEAAKSFAFFAVGVEEARMDILKQLSVREPLKLKGLQFRSLFQWLSSSMKSVSQSTPGDVVPVANPATPQGWAAV